MKMKAINKKGAKKSRKQTDYSEKEKSIIENSGDKITNSPEFSKRQFGKTNNTINQIVHITTHSYANLHSNTILIERGLM